jgi:hypothetical protein
VFVYTLNFFFQKIINLDHVRILTPKDFCINMFMCTCTK